VKLKELRAQRAKQIQTMRDVLDRAEAEGRDLSAEEVESCDRIEQEIDKTTAEIRRWELVSELDVESRSLIGQTGAGVPEERKLLTLQEWRQQQAPVRVQDDPEYREAFFRYMTVRDPRELSVEELRVLSKATAGAGLNLVPTSFSRQLIDVLRWMGSIRSLATVITTDSGEAFELPTVTAHGTASWLAENAAFSPSDETFGKITLNAYKAGTIMIVSEELLQDSAFDLDAYISREFGERIGVLEETAYMTGDGSGKPTGLVGSASAGVTAASATAITADEMLDLYYSLAPQYRPRASFLVSDAAEKILRKLKGSDGQYQWQTALTDGAPNTFNGRPVYAHPDLAVPATGVVPALFGDFSYYTIRDVNGIAFQRLVELYAANGQVGFRAYHRTDGKLTNTAAVKKLTMA